MKLFPILFVVCLAFACNLSRRLNIDKIVTDAEKIRDGEAKYYAEQHRYASLNELINAGSIGEEVSDGKDAGFFIEVNASEKYYTLSIYPDYEQGVVKPEEQEQFSFFCDERGILRGELDPNKRANADSDEIHPKH